NGGNCGGNTDFEVRLFEDANQSRMEFIYGPADPPQGDGSSASVGVQKDTGSQYTQYSCDEVGRLTAGLRLIVSQPPCSTPTPTATCPAGGCPTNTFTRTNTV